MSSNFQYINVLLYLVRGLCDDLGAEDSQWWNTLPNQGNQINGRNRPALLRFFFFFYVRVTKCWNNWKLFRKKKQKWWILQISKTFFESNKLLFLRFLPISWEQLVTMPDMPQKKKLHGFGVRSWYIGIFSIQNVYV